MTEYIYSFFIIAWEIMCCKLFMENFAQKRSFNKKGYGILLLGGLVVVDYVISFIFIDSVIVKEAFVVLAGVIFMQLYFQQKLYKTFILFVLFQAVVLVIDYFTIIGMVHCFPQISMNTLQYPMVVAFITIIGKMFLFSFIIIIKRNINMQQEDDLTDMEWLRFAIFPIFTILIIMAIVTNFDVVTDTKQSDMLLDLALGLLFLNVIVFFLIRDILERENQIREDKLFRIKIQNETEMYKSISRNQERQQKKIHEYKNHIACIIGLAEKRNYDKLNEYVFHLDEQMKEATDLIDTNHPIINAILNTKYKEAREKGILFVVKVNNLSEIKIQDEDLVIILANLLNNAIEACERGMAKKYIKIKLVKEKSSFIIAISNGMDKAPEIKNDKIQTTKTEEKQEHGIGLSNIIETVEKYQGSYNMDYSDDEFRFTILISDEFCMNRADSAIDIVE